MIWRRIGQTTSLTATMTGLAMWLFVIATWIWESLSLRWPDDDFLWFLLRRNRRRSLGVHWTLRELRAASGVLDL